MRLAAYPLQQIRNLRHRTKAKKWLKAGIISTEAAQQISDHFPVDLYMPKLPIRILLFLAGMIGIPAAIGLYAITLVSSDAGIYSFLIIIGLILLFGTDYVIIQRGKHFRSGFAQASYYLGISCLLAGIHIYLSRHGSINFSLFCLHLMLLTGIAAFRYLDRICLTVSILSLNAFVFLYFNGLEGSLRFVIPFVLAIINFGIYLTFSQLYRTGKWRGQHEMFQILRFKALLLTGFSINVFIVQEAVNSLMGFQGRIPFWWFFIGSTVVVPAIMLWYGWNRRQHLTLRAGMICVLAGIAGIHHYYALNHPEFSLTIAGLALLLFSVQMIRYFSKSRDGITSRNIGGGRRDLADIVIATQIGGASGGNSQSDLPMGGGHFGGGGAGSEY